MLLMDINLGILGITRSPASIETLVIKTKISIILDKELERIGTTLAGLEPNDRASFILKLLQYTIPKLSTNHIAVTEKEPKPEFKGFEFLPTIEPKKRL